MSWLTELYGPNDVGKLPGNEVPLWSWSDPATGETYTIYRIVSKAQALLVNHTFQVQWARDAWLMGLMFLLKKSSSPVAMSVVAIEQFRRDHASFDSWKNSSEYPKKGLDSWSIEMFERFGVSGAIDSRPPVDLLELSLWVTFLLDYLELNPDWIRQSVRSLWRVPCIASLEHLESTQWSRPFPVPEQPHVLFQDNWRTGISPEKTKLMLFMRELVGHIGRLNASEPARNMIRMSNPFFEMDLHWKLNTFEDPRDAVLLFLAQRRMETEPWVDTPMKAIEASGMLVDEEGVQDWIDAHSLKGAHEVLSKDLFESYLLLGDEIPPLMRSPFLLELLKSYGIALPWQKP